MPSRDFGPALSTAGIVLAVVLASGCVGLPTATEDECRYEPVTPTSYPEIPATLTNESVGQFATEFERARFYERFEGERVRVSFNARADRVNRTGSGWLVDIDGGFAEYGCNDGVSYVADGIVNARYFVNETAAYRADGVGHPESDVERNATIDPRENGTRVL